MACDSACRLFRRVVHPRTHSSTAHSDFPSIALSFYRGYAHDTNLPLGPNHHPHRSDDSRRYVYPRSRHGLRHIHTITITACRRHLRGAAPRRGSASRYRVAGHASRRAHLRRERCAISGRPTCLNRSNRLPTITTAWKSSANSTLKRRPAAVRSVASANTKQASSPHASASIVSSTKTLSKSSTNSWATALPPPSPILFS